MSADGGTPPLPDTLPAELVAQYREQIPIAIRALEAALERCRREPGEGAAELRRLAHQLAGSGGSYGFPEITSRAREAEHAAEPALAEAVNRLVEVLRTFAARPADADLGAVLIVHHDPVTVRRCEQLLGGAARTVRGAATTAEALALSARQPFDLLVLDLRLPEEESRRLLLAAAGAPTRPAGAPSPARPGRILLAEDDQLTAAMIRHRLERAGYEIRHAGTGAAALAAAEKDPPDLFVLDIKMPEMDGLQLLRRLRAAEWGKTIPAIMLTALGSDQDLERAFGEGADDYLVKPFSPAELLARVERLIRRR